MPMSGTGNSVQRLDTRRLKPRFASNAFQARDSLLFSNHWGPANPSSMKIDSHFNTVCDFNEGNATRHSVVLAVKCHRSFDCAYACPLAGNRERQGLGLRDSAYRKVTRQIKSVWAGLFNFR